MLTIASNNVRYKLNDIAECAICKSTFNDPRSLPCLHTYCRECVEGFSRYKQPGDELACPECRGEFTLPANGVDGLPKNFFVEQLVEIADTSTVIYCNIHQDRVVDLFCSDCQMAACVKCILDVHRSHRCIETNDAVNELRRQMKSDVERMTDVISTCHTILNAQNATKEKLSKAVDGIEREICERVEHVKRVLDSEQERLLRNLKLREAETMEKIQRVVENIARHTSLVENLADNTQELGTKGTASCVAQQSRTLHERAYELTKLEYLNQELNDLNSLEVRFEAVRRPVEENEPLIGQVHWQPDDVVQSVTASPTPTLTHVISDNGDVVGLTLVDDRLFVLRSPGVRQIQVYDRNTLSKLRPLQVKGHSGTTINSGLTSCETNQCVYVSDSDKNTVFKVELSRNNKVSSWLVDRTPSGMSVNTACNLLVACLDANKLQEYTTNGSLVREICLRSNDVDFSPCHAVQLTSDQFVVSYRNAAGDRSVFDVAQFDAAGRVEVSYTNQLQSTTRHNFSWPRRLSVDECSERILVADCECSRIVILNRSLRGCARELDVTSVNRGLRGPCCLHFDASRNQLFVGEWWGRRRILMFDNVI